MNLQSYFNRIAFKGNARPDLATLGALHQSHQLAVPFENLDVQLGRKLDIGVDAAYQKIVDRGRGGWCYEMNGVFGWALRQIGFDVIRVSAGVMRERLGDIQLGNHLCLLVRLDRQYLVDVGFGGTLLHPLPLEAVQRTDRPYRVELRDSDDRYWRFIEAAGGEPFSFDFLAEAADERLLAEKCAFLNYASTSPFVQNLVVQRRTLETHVSLRGRVLTTIHSDRQERMLLTSAAQLVTVLHDIFGLDIPEAVTLWPAICARHDALFPVAANH